VLSALRAHATDARINVACFDMLMRMAANPLPDEDEIDDTERWADAAVAALQAFRDDGAAAAGVRGACAATLLAVAPALAGKQQRAACRARVVLALELAMQHHAADLDLQGVVCAAHSALLLRARDTASPEDDEDGTFGAACITIAEVLRQAVHRADETRQLAAVLALVAIISARASDDVLSSTLLATKAAAAAAAALVSVLCVSLQRAHPHALFFSCSALLFLLQFGPDAKRAVAAAGTATALHGLLRVPAQQLLFPMMMREVATKLLQELVA
jgi:hypothetical protein